MCSPSHTDTPPACWVEEDHKRPFCTPKKSLCTPKRPLCTPYLDACMQLVMVGWSHPLGGGRGGGQGDASPEGDWCLRSTHLLDPLQQRQQPVLIHLAVTVQEGQDTCFGHVCPSDSGSDQTWSRTHRVSCSPHGWLTSPASSTRASPGF